MYTVTIFGTQIQGTGSIRQTLETAGRDVGNNDAYVNGNMVSLDDQPPAGSNVTFRPRASGKA